MANYTSEQYNALLKAIGQGVRSVYYGDKRVDYRSLEEMKQIKSDMEAALGIKKPSRKRYVSHSKGLR